MHNCCNDYTRSQLLRSAAAEAGKGLPVIEPGMPSRPGPGSRGAGSSPAAPASRSPSTAPRRSRSRPSRPGSPRRRQTDKILVSVFFDGGIDALSVLAPVGDSALRAAAAEPRLRARRRRPNFTEDHDLRGIRPPPALATLHGEGKVSAFPAIGYDHPDQSHFTSRHYYEIGELEVGFRTGWLGRYLDAVGDDDNPLQGLSMDGSLSPMIATAEQAGGGDRQRRRLRPLVARSANRSTTRCSTASPASARCPRTLPASARCGGRPPRPTSCARTSAGSANSPARSPTRTTNFAHKLAGLAAYIAFGLPMRVVTIRAAGGYDTHAGQAVDLERNLRETCEGLLAFQRDLEARGLADRVLVEMWSEFGRRPEENGSAGHRPRRRRLRLRDRLAKPRARWSANSPAWRTSTTNENLRVTSDFRAMYCSLLEQWLGHDAASIIPGAVRVRRPTCWSA